MCIDDDITVNEELIVNESIWTGSRASIRETVNDLYGNYADKWTTCVLSCFEFASADTLCNRWLNEHSGPNKRMHLWEERELQMAVTHTQEDSERVSVEVGLSCFRCMLPLITPGQEAKERTKVETALRQSGSDEAERLERVARCVLSCLCRILPLTLHGPAFPSPLNVRFVLFFFCSRFRSHCAGAREERMLVLLMSLNSAKRSSLILMTNKEDEVCVCFVFLIVSFNTYS